jgi:N-acetylglucosamine-6-phosphate deacetylase
MRAAGLEDGKYMLGALKVIVKDHIARVESGSLAGSTTNILNCVKNMVEKVGVNSVEAVNMASLNPSKLLGVDDVIGSLRKGKKANFAVINDNFEVFKTIINGQVVNER